MIIKKSFTLSEIMIAMLVMGIVIAACVPIILSMAPNKNAIMIKKAYYTTEQIVSDLINDSVNYPTGDFKEDNAIVGSDFSADTKFSCLFAKKMNVDEKNNSLSNFCNRAMDEDANNSSHLIYTQDGMLWNFASCNFASNDYCRIDVSATTDFDKTRYSQNMGDCIPSGGGWGGDACTQPGHADTRKLKLGKAVFFISNDGGISLINKPAIEAQEEVQDIINGKTSLLGK